MDYLFMIELNERTADLAALRETIYGLNEEIPYLEIVEPDKGLVGIVRLPPDKDDNIWHSFFDNIRGKVAVINGLPRDEAFSLEDIPAGKLARWARASMFDVLEGFDIQDPPTPNLLRDDNTYKIVDTMKGGIGGKW